MSQKAREQGLPLVESELEFAIAVPADEIVCQRVVANDCSRAKAVG